MAKGLTTIKTLAGSDLAFQPSLDKNRIMALAELKLIERAEMMLLSALPAPAKATWQQHLPFEAVKAGRSVYFPTLADIIA